MVACSVVDCDTTRDYNPDKCSFHRFPINSDARNVWLRMIDRPNWTPKKSSCICSKHFEEKYFRMRRMRRILIKSAIPTKFVPIKIPPIRIVSSYVYRDILPEPSTRIPSSLQSTSTPALLSSFQPSSPPSTPSQLEFSPRKKKLLSKCSKLRDKINLYYI